MNSRILVKNKSCSTALIVGLACGIAQTGMSASSDERDGESEGRRIVNTCATFAGSDGRSGDGFDPCWYIGVGAGYYFIDPEGRNSDGWSSDEDDNNDAGALIYIGKRFSPHWFAELRYADLGESGLVNQVDPALNAGFPNAAITYEVPSLSVGYYFRNPDVTVNPFIKVGVSAISNDIEGVNTTAGFTKENSVQLSFGAGVQFDKRDSAWFARIEFDDYDRDAYGVNASVGRYLGGRKVIEPKIEVPEPVPLPVAPPLPVIKEPVAPRPPVVKVPEVSCTKYVLNIDRITFATDSALLSDHYQQQLSLLASDMVKLPSIELEVDGHADARASDAYNFALSERRANTVTQFLVDSGVESSRISTKFYGEKRPVADNITTEGLRANRRVELKLLENQVCEVN